MVAIKRRTDDKIINLAGRTLREAVLKRDYQLNPVAFQAALEDLPFRVIAELPLLHQIYSERQVIISIYNHWYLLRATAEDIDSTDAQELRYRLNHFFAEEKD